VRGATQRGDSTVHESIIGSRFTGCIAGTTTVAGKPAILPTIEGRAWITGLSSELLDRTDPYPTGYGLADTCGISGTTSQ
jgi:proline racemase